MFEPKTREKAAGKPRLLVINGYGSHIQADFIAHYMENGIDLLFIPSYYSHLLQPLDVNVFSAFKRAYGSETDAVSRFNIQRIQKVKQLQIFMRLKIKAVTINNV